MTCTTSTITTINGDITKKDQVTFESVSRLLDIIDKNKSDSLADILIDTHPRISQKLRADGLPKKVYCGSSSFPYVRDKLGHYLSAVEVFCLEEYSVIFSWADDVFNTEGLFSL